MILVGIDVAKDKHDCFSQNSEGKVLYKAFPFANNYAGFEELYTKILSCNDDIVRVGLEATGHYSYNLLGFSQFRKSLSLRKTKTDKVDAKTITLMLATESADNAYSLQAYQNEELKSRTRYRFDIANQRSKLKQSLSRLITLLFPNSNRLFPLFIPIPFMPCC